MNGITAALLAPLLNRPPAPRLTWYGAGGNRTELSTSSLANWSAKVAGLLVDELGARPGDVVFVGLRPGWQTLPVLLGAWWAGLVVVDTDDPAAVAAFVPDGADPELGAADEVFVVSGHPLGAPSRNVAAHQRDFSGAVLPQADRFGRTIPLHRDHPAIGGSADLGIGAVLDMASAAAAELGTGARLLSTADWSLPLPGVAVLLGPLAADGSLVQLEPGAADLGQLEHIAAAEHADRFLGAGSVPGVQQFQPPDLPS